MKRAAQATESSPAEQDQALTSCQAMLKQRDQEIALVNSIQEALAAEMDMASIYEMVGERIREVFDAQVVVIRTFDDESKREIFEYAFEKGQRFYPEPRPLGGFNLHLRELRETEIINTNFEEYIAKYSVGPRKVAGEAPKSAVWVPLIAGDQVRGNVSLQNVDRENAFSEADGRILTTLTNSMALALENARLFAETRQQASELDTVNRISRALNSQLEFDALVHLIGEQVRSTFRADIAYVALYDQEADMIHFPYEYGDLTPSRRFGSGLTEKIITTREPLLINRDLSTAKKQLQAADIGREPASYVGVPIISGGEAIGVVSVQSMEEENRFNNDDLRLLGTIADHVAVAIRNAEAYRRLNDALAHLKQAQEQLIQSEKMASLGALTAGIAHEIKNPLNFVNNFATLTAELVDEIEAEISADPDVKAAELQDILGDIRLNASKIAEHGRRADGIVRSMLEHSRGTKGERAETNLNELLEEYLNLAYHGMRAQSVDFNCTIERAYDDAVGTVMMIPQDIGRVFINLLNNAFYSVHQRTQGGEPGYAPTVSVATRRRGGRVEITIRDNGTGIPEDVLQRIFEPFFTTKPTGSGTGLGLSLSYDIVAKGHAGTMTVDSHLGQYTEFSIQLPG